MNEEGLSDIQRLRQLLRWMKVPEERIGRLDFAWLAEHLSDYNRHPHYTEARALLVQTVEPNRNGKTKRMRK